MQETNSQKQKSISILLGAGFSAPAGFPLACQVNEFIRNFDFDAYCIDRFGCLMEKSESCDPNEMIGGFHLCKKGMEQYLTNNDDIFDYECFFDFLYDMDGVEAMARVDYGDDFREVVGEAQRVYKKIVQRALDMKESLFEKDIEKIYQNFLNTLKVWSQDAIVNVHTLNHDTLFESFRSLEDFKGMVSDGFEWKYDPYCSIDGNRKRSPVEQYTAHYTKPIRLYKLHGSLDYAWVYGYNCEDNNGVIKNNNNYSFNNIKYNPNSTYVSFEEPLILTGHESKEKRYANPIYFRQVMTMFETNLQEAEMLVIIGYGGKDDGINERIIKYFDFRNKPVIFINPSTSDFAQQINASHVKKSISEVIHQDFKIQ